jgi:hypothetical protein
MEITHMKPQGHNFFVMTTIRELLELGYLEYAKKALKERGGQTPLCCKFYIEINYREMFY